MMKKLYLSILSICLVLGMMTSVHAYAQEAEGGEYKTEYDTLYGVLSNGDFAESDGAELAEAYDIDAKYVELLKNGFLNCDETIDLRGAGFTKESLRYTVTNVLNITPELFYVDKGYSYSYNSLGIVSITPTYRYDKATVEVMKKELLASIKEAKKKVDITGMSDVEIALAYHDYIATTTAYAMEELDNGTVGNKNEYDMYGVLVNHRAVCQGYTIAYMYFLREAGIECNILSSDTLMHAWNAVRLDGKWYHVDVTWDDPVYDKLGRVHHDYFLLSSAKLKEVSSENDGYDRSDMEVEACVDAVYTVADSTTYDGTNVWTGVTSAFSYKAGTWYYITGASNTISINSYSFHEGKSRALVTESSRWTVGSTAYYSGVFSRTYFDGEKLYYSLPDSIKTYDVTTGESGTAYTKPASYSADRHFYSFGYENGNIVAGVMTSPNDKTYTSAYPVIQHVLHKWENGICEICKMSVDEYLKESKESLVSYSISLKGNIALNYAMELSDEILSDPTAYMQFDLGGEKLSPIYVKDVAYDSTYQIKDGDRILYVFSCPLGPTQLDTEITGTIHTSVCDCESYTHTVREYIDQLSSTPNASADLKQLANDLSVFAAYTCAVFEYDNTDLNKLSDAEKKRVSETIVDENKAYSRVIKGDTLDGITYEGSSLLIMTNTTIRHYFRVSEGHDISEYSFMYNGRILEVKTSEGRYYVEIKDIPATRFGQATVLTVVMPEQNASSFITYSPLSYLSSMTERETSSELLKNMLRAMYLYGNSASEIANK